MEQASHGLYNSASKSENRETFIGSCKQILFPYEGKFHSFYFFTFFYSTQTPALICFVYFRERFEFLSIRFRMFLSILFCFVFEFLLKGKIRKIESSQKYL